MLPRTPLAARLLAVVALPLLPHAVALSQEVDTVAGVEHRLVEILQPGSALQPATGGTSGTSESLPQTFEVEIAGLSPLDVLRAELDDLTVPVEEAGGGGALELVPGLPVLGEIRLTVPASQAAELESWAADAAHGSAARRTVTVRLSRSSGEELRRYTFFDCEPVSLDSSVPAERTLALSAERVELSGPGAHLVDARWSTADQEETELTLAGAVASQRADLQGWINALALDGAASTRDVVVTSRDAQGDLLDARAFFGAVPVRYRFPSLDSASNAAPQETLVLRAVRVEPVPEPAGDAAGGAGDGSGSGAAAGSDPPEDPPGDSGTAAAAWIFHLRSGRTIEATSYRERPAEYEVTRTDGRRVRVAKRDVERIERAR